MQDMYLSKDIETVCFMGHTATGVSWLFEIRYNFLMKLRHAVFFVLLLASACSGKDGGHHEVTGIDGVSDVRDEAFCAIDLAWPALAMLHTGDNPLWFEIGENGPVLIESPEAATLVPYTPWPHARFVTNMQAWDGFIVMTINRDGFLVLGGGGNAGEAVLYRVADSLLWDSYTAESVFFWDAKPAVLLYRNDFFVDPLVPPLNPQVYILDSSSSVPVSAVVPALDDMQPGWEAELLRRGPDGFWYYRVKEKGRLEGEIAYFRSEDLSGEGSRVSVGEWRNSGRPESPEKIPGDVAALLEKLAEFDLAKTGVIRIVSPDFEGGRFFSLPENAAADPIADADDQALLLGFYESHAPIAIAVTPDGRGLYSCGMEYGFRNFSLPVLPEGFVYTGIALLGDVLVASWEEQQGAGIGAAGFMTQTANILPL